MNGISLTRRGFTLIELLIVVAIIAILAAIAVPNFLEAQTRSKVSRVKSDMRSVATAIESYIVDNNKAPIGTAEFRYYKQTTGNSQPIASNQLDARQSFIFGQLTSPIAYLTSPPLDPFVNVGQRIDLRNSNINNFDQTEPELRWYNYESVRSTAALISIQQAVNEAPSLKWTLDSLGPTKNRSFEVSTGGEILLADPIISAGKIEEPSSSAFFGYPDGVYDPTNGTLSFGIIVRSNFGIAE